MSERIIRTIAKKERQRVEGVVREDNTSEGLVFADADLTFLFQKIFFENLHASHRFSFFASGVFSKNQYIISIFLRMSEHTKVSAEDQALLNKFARSYQQQNQLKAELKEAKTLVENINEASDEILLLDDEDSASIPCRIGSCFVHFNGDSLNEHLEGKKATAEKVLAQKTTELNTITAEMERIKKVLYGKFGDQINLDADE
ncbi:hypothetical protein CRE_10767 [Caenorhabditis remanei]|uniref:Prefoldin subunit 4 n=2 Tax=Caenorhabditis remanei TaxID=31234 RepID=E3NTJ0_CAERE|nr:hypothetical protein CRE_10767 [Caenorhabditis remanei]